MPTELLIAVRYQTQSAWAAGFFPPDLPPAWQPIYLGNEIRAVLTRAEELNAASDEERRDAWLEAIEAGLKVFLEPSSVPLAEAFHDAAIQRIEWDAESSSLFTDRGRADGLQLLLLDTAQAPEPARTRSYLDAALEIDAATTIVLTFDGIAGLDTARQARTLATFMGW